MSRLSGGFFRAWLLPCRQLALTARLLFYLTRHSPHSSAIYVTEIPFIVCALRRILGTPEDPTPGPQVTRLDSAGAAELASRHLRPHPGRNVTARRFEHRADVSAHRRQQGRGFTGICAGWTLGTKRCYCGRRSKRSLCSTRADTAIGERRPSCVAGECS